MCDGLVGLPEKQYGTQTTGTKAWRSDGFLASCLFHFSE